MRTRGKPLFGAPIGGPPDSWYDPPDEGPSLSDLIEGHDLSALLEAKGATPTEAIEELLEELSGAELAAVIQQAAGLIVEEGAA